MNLERSKLGRIRILVVFRVSYPDPVFSRRSDPDPVFSRRSDPDPGKTQPDPQPCLGSQGPHSPARVFCVIKIQKFAFFHCLCWKLRDRARGTFWVSKQFSPCFILLDKACIREPQKKLFLVAKSVFGHIKTKKRKKKKFRWPLSSRGGALVPGPLRKNFFAASLIMVSNPSVMTRSGTKNRIRNQIQTEV